MTTSAIAGIFGTPPVLIHGITERKKYETLWGEHPAYRNYSPGEEVAQVFLSQARPKAGAEVIDFGTGTGRGALALALFGNLKVTMVDFAENCLDPELKQALTTQSHVLKFVQADLIRSVPVSAEYGFCTDVMEHIQPECVDKALDNILHSAQHVFFQISTVDDAFGAVIGHPLHLTVRPYSWWLERFKERDCLIHWSKETSNGCMFYVTAWRTGEDVAAAGILNTESEQIRKNVAANVKGPWKQVSPHETNNMECVFLCGGPSLAGQLDKIRELRAAGAKLVTVNGTYDWAIQNGLVPSCQIVVDARPFNARFTRTPHQTCLYLIASQCDPSVLEGLPPERTYLWHTQPDLVKDILDEHYGTLWFPIPGGSTVTLRAIPMLRMLGYKRFHMFGFDSCLGPDDAHHSYPQPENDSPVVVNTTVGGRVFKCHPWMIAQAQEFMGLVKYLGDEFEVELYGDGLINHILRTGAELTE